MFSKSTMDFNTPEILRRGLAQRHALASINTSNERFSRIFISGFIGINTLVYGGWLYTKFNPSYQPVRGRGGPGGRRQGSSSSSPWASRALQRLTGWLTTEFMQDNFLLGTRNLRAGRWWTLLTYAVSHRSLSHLASDMATFHVFADVAVRLYDPLSVAAVLCLGSAAAGALAQLSDWRHRRQDGVVQRRGAMQILVLHHAQGASAITKGLAMAVTVLRPCILVRSPLLPSVSVPLWVCSLGWFLYDGYELSGVMEDGLQAGHPGHLGGMAFGAAYAGLRLLVPAHRDASFMNAVGRRGDLMQGVY
ncbi:hypothetical protein PG997_006039 [Apiospora hydei]|uniref:Peptidase S54 rhomboid domain-containing protein n=1 Tax=Apiospora hydei TaxID=1337664 RepID=A0ABR1WRJ1_9PEZI